MEDLQIISHQISELKEQIATQAIYAKEFLTAPEAAEFLGISIHQLYKYSSQHVLPYYKPQNKLLYFKRSELVDFIEVARIRSQTEIETGADKFLQQKPNLKKL